MATIRRTSTLTATPAAAWDFLDRYTRSEVHIFSNCLSERQVDDFRVVVTQDGRELWERNITIDPDHRRAVYTVRDFPGAEHHQAEMRVDTDADGRAVLVWLTDILPDPVALALEPHYDVMFAEMVAAVEASAR